MKKKIINYLLTTVYTKKIVERKTVATKVYKKKNKKPKTNFLIILST